MDELAIPVDGIPPSPYQQWVDSENVPVLGGLMIPNVHGDLPLKMWDRKGVKGCFFKLMGGEGSMDSYIIEIPPKGQTEPEKYMFEEEYVVLSGKGATSLWAPGDTRKQTFEWQAGSIFSPPMNTYRQHFNGSPDTPVRLLVVSNAPVMFNVFRSKEFIFGCDHVFKDRFSGEEDYYSGKGKALPNRVWRSNFVPDINNFPLIANSLRGTGNTTINFQMANNIIESHIAQFPVSTYKPAHRHGPGAHILILAGEGFSLMWEKSDANRGKGKRHKLDWKPGSFLAPPDMWFHQHFNAGTTPVRFFAVHYGYWRVLTEDLGPETIHVDTGNQINYEDEEPEVLSTFVDEVEKRGGKVQPVETWRVSKTDPVEVAK